MNPLQKLMDYLEGDYSLMKFLHQVPTVTREMAIQALEEAKDSLLLVNSLALILRNEIVDSLNRLL